MGLFTPDINSLNELYTTMLKRSLNSERQIVEDGLPTMIQNSTHPEVANAFRTHLEESKEQISRLERILGRNLGDVSDSKCKVTAALIAEGSSTASDAKDDGLRDVVLLAAGNQVEHHEIAVYGTLVNLATLLGKTQDATLLKQTLQEEKHADALLTSLAEQVNVEALAV
jgi:ferritin-like metal-binding protein YciE